MIGLVGDGSRRACTGRLDMSTSSRGKPPPAPRLRRIAGQTVLQRSSPFLRGVERRTARPQLESRRPSAVTVAEGRVATVTSPAASRNAHATSTARRRPARPGPTATPADARADPWRWRSLGGTKRILRTSARGRAPLPNSVRAFPCWGAFAILTWPPAKAPKLKGGRG